MNLHCTEESVKILLKLLKVIYGQGFLLAPRSWIIANFLHDRIHSCGNFPFPMTAYLLKVDTPYLHKVLREKFTADYICYSLRDATLAKKYAFSCDSAPICCSNP